MMFGLPVVFNPLLGIPLVIVPLVTTTIAYYATSLRIYIAKTSVLVLARTTPPIISGYLATNGDWKASLYKIILIAIGVLIYLPFCKMTNKKKNLILSYELGKLRFLVLNSLKSLLIRLLIA